MNELYSFLEIISNNSDFKAELSKKGGYVTFSNSGRRGGTKYFQIGLENIIQTLRDILNHLDTFRNLKEYEEKAWRDNGAEYFTDPVANANSTVQTKPLFSTLSKIIIWGNQPLLNNIDPDQVIALDRDYIQTAIDKLDIVSKSFTPQNIIRRELHTDFIQKIYYGCPGSGKSHEVKRITNTSNAEGFSGLSSIERRQAYQKFLDNKHGHKKTYKGGGTNIDALTHPKLMEYISSCTEFEINSLFEISNEEDFNAIIEALKGCDAYQNDSITKGSGCHWETGLKSYGEFLKDQIPNTEPRKDAVFRTTFHPDTDYASFVGCYKPSMNDGVIEYSFTPQVFTNAYIAAWENTKKPIYLVIEEINRGNCAQIFGDLFQLLDRDKVTGKSEYPIKADKDLVAHIEKVLGAGHEGIKNGELCLPSNLIIYATMNTSDQSLFPMDSAFKRRWDWEYVPINYSKDIDSGKFIIEVDEDTKYSWVEFLESVNDKIYDTTNSEDKQMGNFFIKKSIKANEFVNKVMFYLWNEVCKEEYGTQRNFFRKGKEGKTEFKFTELFGDNQVPILKEFMTSLGVEPIGKKTEEPAAE